MPDSMVEQLDKWAQMVPDRLFAADSYGNECSYNVAMLRVKTIGVNLLEYGIKANDCLMVECDQSVDFLLIKLACELIGAICVPIEMGASSNRKEVIREETESVLWIYKTDMIDTLTSISYHDVTRDNEKQYHFEFPHKSQTSEILYTTGTTGKSKGVIMTNGANIAVAENIRDGVKMREDNVEFIPVPICHSHGIRSCYANLLNGSTVVIMDGLINVNHVFDMLQKYSVSAIDASPNAMKMLIKLSKGKFWEFARSLDYIQLGTASLPENLKSELLENLTDVRLYNFYGSTESGRSCVLDFSHEKFRLNCVGKSTKNAEIVFTDESHNVVHTDKEHLGLLATKGPMNMVGYWRNEELTNTILENGFVYTSDLGYKDDEGFCYVLGRNDDVINYNGIKISPEEIEEVVTKYNDIIDAACASKEDAKMGQVPKLYIVVRNPESFDMKGFTEYLQANIDNNKVPKQIEYIDEIPRTYNGKIQRNKLRT